MRKIIILSLAATGLAVIIYAVSFSLTAEKNETTTGQRDNTLTIYAYDSLVSEWGLLPAIINQFEEKNDVKIQLIGFADTGTMLAQTILEKNKPHADIIMGLDNVDFERAAAENILIPYKPARATELASDLYFDELFTMTPFDYGYVAFVYDTEALSFSGPISLNDLTDKKYKDKIVIEQPGLSSPGTQLLLWTQAAFGGSSQAFASTFWKNFQPNVLTVTPDWSTAYYNFFLKGEAPIALSYITSPAYHIDQEGTDRYQAIPIKEGYIRQVEGIGVVNGTQQKAMAQAFIDYVLSTDVQNRIPTTQWVFPVLDDASQRPAAFNQIINPSSSQTLTLTPENIRASYSIWLSEWNKQFGIE